MNAPAEDGAALLRTLGQHRDRTTFSALFRHYAPRIKQHLLGRKVAPATADELVQEVMLTVWRKAEQFDPERGTASSWIFAIVRSCFVDRVRREKRAEVSASDPVLEGAIDEGRAPDSATDDRDVQRALATLPPEQAHVLRLAYLGGLSLQDIAADAQLPLGTVKTRARLGLARLRQLFTGEPS